MDQVTVIAQSTDELHPATRSAIIDVCVAAHDEPDFRQLFSYIPTGGTHFLAYVAQTLVGHAVVTTRWLTVDAGPRLKTAYVDAVATAPAYQGRGVGSALLRYLAASLAAYDIACLETERSAFYTRLGWELWRGPLAGRRDGRQIAMPRQTGVLILRLPQTPPIPPDATLVIEYDGRFW